MRLKGTSYENDQSQYINVFPFELDMMLTILSKPVHACILLQNECIGIHIRLVVDNR